MELSRLNTLSHMVTVVLYGKHGHTDTPAHMPVIAKE